MKSTAVLFAILLSYLGLLGGCATNTSMTTSMNAAIVIKSPDIVENGNIVPFQLEFAPPIAPGQEVKIRTDGNVAMSIMVFEGSVSRISTRVKMQKTGELVAEKATNGNVLQTSKKIIVVRQPGVVTGNATPIDKPLFKEKINDNNYKLLFNSENGYQGRITLQDNEFKVEIIGSNAVSNNPFIDLDGSFSKNLQSSLQKHISRESLQLPKDKSTKTTTEVLTKEKTDDSAKPLSNWSRLMKGMSENEVFNFMPYPDEAVDVCFPPGQIIRRHRRGNLLSRPHDLQGPCSVTYSYKDSGKFLEFTSVGLTKW